MSEWAQAAEHYLEQALDDVRIMDDAIPAVSAALACLRMEVGELPPDEDLLLIDVDDAGIECRCPPDLVERGGFVSTCPEHGQLAS